MQYRAEIDGLRALAVLPVIFFHAGFSFFSGGYVGVDIFFVISGYLITSIILDEIDAKKFNIINFYERRARRILPALFFILLLTTVVGWLWLLPNEYRQYSQSLIGVVTFTSNIFFYLTGGYFGASNELKPLIHTWSLSVEEQFYLLFPIFLLLIARARNKLKNMILWILVILSLLFAQWQSTRDTGFNYLLLPSRFWELAVGSLIAMHLMYSDLQITRKWLKDVLSIIGALLVLISIIFFDNDTPFPSVYTVLPVAGVSLIILFADNTTLMARYLSYRPVVQIGLISYSAYLWHQVLFSMIRHRSANEPEQITFVYLSVLTLVLAYLTWRFIEQPFRNKTQFNRRAIFGMASGGIIFFGFFGYAGHIKDGFKSRLPADVATVHITREHEQSLRNAGCPLNGKSIDLAECKQGIVDSPDQVALVGDSHAAALVKTIAELAKTQQFSFLPLVHSSCPLNFSISIHEGSLEEQYCAEYQQALKRLVLGSDVSTVIVHSRYDFVGQTSLSSKQQLQLEQHVSAIKEILSANKKVILIYPIPVYSTHISDYMAKNLWFYGGTLPKVTLSTTVFEQRIKQVTSAYDAIGDLKNLIRVKPKNALCEKIQPGICVTEFRGQPLYFDDDHLSEYGAELVLSEVYTAIK